MGVQGGMMLHENGGDHNCVIAPNRGHLTPPLDDGKPRAEGVGYIASDPGKVEIWTTISVSSRAKTAYL